MPFIGNQPALSYTSFAKQDFTTSATTSYTLDQPVANENEIALFINFVRQEPTTAYTASGTSLTLTSATSASDDMYCVFLGKAVQTVNPPNGSVGTTQLADSSVSLAKLSATGTKDSTTFLRGDNTFASAGGDNTPAFFASISSDQSIPNNSTTLVALATKVLDTDSAFDNTASNYKFTVPSGEAGNYQINFGIRNSNFTTARIDVQIKKNGSEVVNAENASGGNYDTAYGGAILNLSVGDYLQMYVYQASGSSQNIFSARNSCFMSGYKLIGV